MVILIIQINNVTYRSMINSILARRIGYVKRLT